MPPKFSIIMPVWNRANIVGRAIKSVLSQSFADYELLIIDDGSADGTVDTVLPYLSEKVKLLRIKHKGVSAARNHALKRATGEFVAYLDSDNVWHDDFLQKMYSAVSSMSNTYKLAYCKCNVYEKDPAGGGLRLARIIGEEFSFRRLLIKNRIDINTFVHSRNCLELTGYFDERLKRLTDWEFKLNMTSKFKPLFVPEVLVDYYFGISPNAISLCEGTRKPRRLIERKYAKFAEPIKIRREAVEYVFEDVPEEKYYDWVRMREKNVDLADAEVVRYALENGIKTRGKCMRVGWLSNIFLSGG